MDMAGMVPTFALGGTGKATTWENVRNDGNAVSYSKQE